MLKKPQYILIITLILLLSWHWRVGMIRFFDADEFSYLRWTALVSAGQLPYRDFFLIIPWAFMAIFSPLFWIFKTPEVFLAARVIHFFIFVGTAGLLSILFGMTRPWKWALLPAVLFAFLPMPFDKFIEIRPDNLSTLFALAGLVLQIKRRWMISGVFYTLSLLVLPKALPFMIVGLVVWFSSSGKGRLAFILGLFIPLLLFFFWSLSAGFSTVWYSLTTMAMEANQFGKNFVMEPHLFFFPNGAFYGGWGLCACLPRL